MNRISPRTLINGADEYLNAAIKVCKPPHTARGRLQLRINMTAYYLLGHSIELSLKAFLLSRGVKYNKLRCKPYSHDLNKLITESRKRKLGNQAKLSVNEVGLIKLLSISYSAKLLEYTEVGYYKLPEYGALYEITNKLVAGIKPHAQQCV